MRPLILAVDDEPLKLRVVEDILHAQGYRVATAVGASAALKLCRVRPKPEVLLTDVRLPVTNGFKLARVIKSLIPSIRVLYMSAAFSESPDLDPRGVRIPGSVLRKPFTAGELVSAVEALMESSGPRGTDATRT